MQKPYLSVVCKELDISHQQYIYNIWAYSYLIL